MIDYIKLLPKHSEKYIGENDLYLEIFQGAREVKEGNNLKKPPLLFVHGAYTGSWMWSKYIPHFVKEGYTCYVMNMRSHYKSRIMDMTKITFEDYIEDIKTVINECDEMPIVIGFSMGGILCQKIAEEVKVRGLVLIDTSISKEVNEIVPYEKIEEKPFETIVAAPKREEESSIDESLEDIIFQRKYLSMEAAHAMNAISCWIKGNEGVSIDSTLITCPSLVISAVNSDEDDRRGKATAQHLSGEYTGLRGTTHTGLLVGERYFEVVERMMEWIKNY